MTPKWGTADAEIKVRLLSTQSTKSLPIVPGVGQLEARHATPAARNSFTANSYLPGPITFIPPKNNNNNKKPNKQTNKQTKNPNNFYQVFPVLTVTNAVPVWALRIK